jgi:hypothetical protein
MAGKVGCRDGGGGAIGSILGRELRLINYYDLVPFHTLISAVEASSWFFARGKIGSQMM